MILEPMRWSLTVITVLALLAGCIGGDPDDGSASGAAAEDVTLASLGVDWPQANVDDVAWPDVPDTPEGLDDTLVERLSEPLQGWAAAAALDPDVWSAQEQPREVLAGLGDLAEESQLEAGEASPSTRLPGKRLCRGRRGRGRPADDVGVEGVSR